MRLPTPNILGAGTAGAALVNELPPEMAGEGAFNPALGALADDGGGAFPD